LRREAASLFNSNPTLTAVAADHVNALSGDTATAQSFRTSLAAGQFDVAAAAAADVEGYGALAEEARSGGFKTITIGIIADVQIIIGGNTESGIGISLTGRPLITCATDGFTVGIAAGADVGVNVGLYYTDNDDIAGPAHGIVFAANVGVGLNAGAWWSYDGAFVGFSFAVSGGMGAEIGECNRIFTRLTQY
jgi:hypothetical protein